MADAHSGGWSGEGWDGLSFLTPDRRLGLIVTIIWPEWVLEASTTALADTCTKSVPWPVGAASTPPLRTLGSMIIYISLDYCTVSALAPPINLYPLDFAPALGSKIVVLHHVVIHRPSQARVGTAGTAGRLSYQSTIHNGYYIYLVDTRTLLTPLRYLLCFHSLALCRHHRQRSRFCTLVAHDS
jgi:hypothetical protein